VPGASFTPPNGPTPDLWYNVDAFAPPRIGYRGNAGRNILSGPGYQTINLSWQKKLILGEQRHLEVRGEVFNLFNHPSFDLPSNSESGEQVFLFTGAGSGFASAPGAGRIFNVRGTSREIQIGIKLVF